MPISVVMPALEMAQETGKLIAWRKKEGESVRKGESLLEVETDKAVLEIESPGDGILAGIRVEEGAVVPVGQTIAWIVGPGESPPMEDTFMQSGRKMAPARVAAAPPEIGPSSEASADTGPRISPKARRLARERGVDVSSLRGSGPDGAIVAEDVLTRPESSMSSAPTPPAALGTVGRLMAERTTQSWTTVPHFFLARGVDAGPLSAAREKRTLAIEQNQGVRISYTDLLILLTARMLTQHSRMNASWSGKAILQHPEVHIALAIAVDDGVVGAVIHDADKIPLTEIALQRRDLSERARSGRLRPVDVAGATFTISNLGMYEVDAFQAIITPPQCAVLAVGRIAERVVARQGRPAICPTMTITLSCDHRVTDGARAALFLGDLAKAIQEPEKWLG